MVNRILLIVVTLGALFLATGGNTRADKLQRSTPLDKHFTMYDYTYPDGSTEITVFVQNGSGECPDFPALIKGGIFFDLARQTP